MVYEKSKVGDFPSMGFLFPSMNPNYTKNIIIHFSVIKKWHSDSLSLFFLFYIQLKLGIKVYILQYF